MNAHFTHRNARFHYLEAHQSSRKKSFIFYLFSIFWSRCLTYMEVHCILFSFEFKSKAYYKFIGKWEK